MKRPAPSHPPPRSFALAPRSLRRALLVAALAFSTGALSACSSKPTMHLNHAEVTGVEVALPLKLGVIVTVYIDIYNPNSYDVAVRRVNGKTYLADKVILPVAFQAPEAGVWLAAKKTTTIAVPVSVPATSGFALLTEAASAPSISYRFQGKADVTATRTLKVESDDYSIDEQGQIPRQQFENTLRKLPIPMP